MITQQEVKDIFEYKDNDLYWRSARNNKIKNDRSAGLITRGYSMIGLKNKKYPKSKIIFLMHHGYIPKRIVFLDKNPHNYSIDNLAAATTSDVLCYSRKRSNNTSGYKGVSYCAAKKGWVVYIDKNKKRKYLGLFKNKEEAAKAYKEAALKLHGEFAYIE